MAGPKHEEAKGLLGSMIYFQIGLMGLMFHCIRMDETRYQGFINGKEADLVWRPNETRPDDDDWPTLVVEVGVTQSENSLINAANWWLSNSGGEVKNVLLDKVYKAESSVPKRPVRPVGTYRTPVPSVPGVCLKL